MPEEWIQCDVIRAGPALGIVYIGLAKHAGGMFKTAGGVDVSPAWFSAAPGCKDEMLATALTAISTGYSVIAFFPDGAIEYNSIARLYVDKNIV